MNQPINPPASQPLEQPLSPPTDQTLGQSLGQTLDHSLGQTSGQSAPPPYDPTTIVNFPNILTMVRIVLVPVVIVSMVLCGHFSPLGMFDSGAGQGSFKYRIISTIMFALAALTDKIDGYWARKYGQITNFGKLADPIADKCLMGGAMLTLSALNALPLWITIVVLAREVLITALRMYKKSRIVLPASTGGKIKTISQTFAIGFYLLPLARLRWWINVPQVVMLLSTAISTYTGIDYLFKIIVA
jgi:CDP-diacylglycerol--glycerol-3-phosphate 3-phosphatidyltransferase